MSIDELWACGQDFQVWSEDVTVETPGRSALLAALLDADSDRVQALLLAGAPIGLREAALLGDAPRVRRLLALGVDPLGGDGWPALHLAAWSGSPRVVRVLLDAGVPVDQAAREPGQVRGATALHLAAVQGHTAVAELLLERGADPGRRDEAGWTALHQACAAGRIGLVKALLVHGAPVDALCGDASPLGLALRHGHPEIAAMLRQVGASD